MSINILCLISIHAPHTGRDSPAFSRLILFHVFQSTRPIRGATASAVRLMINDQYFNPRAPYGARRGGPGPESGACTISIHAPHTGRDSTQALQQTVIKNFNPRAPYGARPARGGGHKARPPRFQSTRPIRGATCPPPLAAPGRRRFQSTRPIRGATKPGGICQATAEFQSTRPIRGATCLVGAGVTLHHDFNPRAPYGARPPPLSQPIRFRRFQSTRPIRGATLSRNLTFSTM